MIIPAHIKQYEIEHPIGKVKGNGVSCGCFIIPYKNYNLGIVASSGGGWEHVSVSVHGVKRAPNWTEMCFVKNLFWDEQDTVVQFHPKKSEYVNRHEVLHLWKQSGKQYTLPPKGFV